MNKDILKDQVYNQFKRIIGFVNVDPASQTFGCADRYYWHYKLHDYYNARFQESSLILTFVYLDKKHQLFQNDKLLQLIKGIINFWLNNLNRNGSVNEIYPFEQSFCATSFSSYIITESILLLNMELTEEQKNKLSKVGGWLSQNANWHIANQVAASAVALHNLSKIIGKQEFMTESQKRVEYLIKEMEINGYFPEYGGFDLGYNTLTMSCLAMFYLKTKNRAVSEVIKKAENKITPYIDKNGHYDNMGMSRNTAFIYPLGLRVVESQIFEAILRGLEQDLILSPNWLDDRYVIGLSNDYLLTYFLDEYVDVNR